VYKKEVKKYNKYCGNKMSTILKCAICHGDIEAVRHLIKQGVDVNELDGSNFTALGLTTITESDMSNIAELLITAGADPINLPSVDDSVFNTACSNNNLKILKLITSVPILDVQ